MVWELELLTMARPRGGKAELAFGFLRPFNVSHHPITCTGYSTRFYDIIEYLGILGILGLPGLWRSSRVAIQIAVVCKGEMTSGITKYSLQV